MTTQTIGLGEPYTTTKSGITGTVKEVITNDNGSMRVLLDVEGKDRWTSVSAN